MLRCQNDVKNRFGLNIAIKQQNARTALRITYITIIQVIIKNY